VQNILGLEADLLNLGWIYRGKTFYNIPAQELYNYTIYSGYKLSKEATRKLCYVNNVTEFHDLIDKTPYSSIYEKDNYNLIEKREREYQKSYYKKFLRENKTNISMVLSYLIVYRIEISDIISIIEQKRYSITINEGINYVSVT